LLPASWFPPGLDGIPPPHFTGVAPGRFLFDIEVNDDAKAQGL
jgi:hypothetical protein